MKNNDPFVCGNNFIQGILLDYTQSEDFLGELFQLAVRRISGTCLHTFTSKKLYWVVSKVLMSRFNVMCFRRPISQ